MFNASKTIARLLHSISGQSYENWRLILIDDVSSENDLISQDLIINQFKQLHMMGDKIEIIWNKFTK